jgi:hypothetical protein
MNSRIRLRNKIVFHLNKWQQLGCLVRSGAGVSIIRRARSKTGLATRLVSGVARDGKAILIYPVMDRKDRVPGEICKVMAEYESRGAIVGTACDIGDAWDIVFNDESQYKRKQKSYLHRYWLEKNKGKDDE